MAGVLLPQKFVAKFNNVFLGAIGNAIPNLLQGQQPVPDVGGKA
jgi:hypothetical protein